MVPVPTSGRVFGMAMRPGLADCAPSGRIRLDAIARWLQDVAWADIEDAGVADHAFWILRRTRIRVNRFPMINEPHIVRTFCSGVGRLVAERRTVISPAGDPDRPDVEATALWVHLDPDSHRPSNVTQDEIDAFSSSGYGERRVSHRLRHPRPEPSAGAKLFDWHFRRVDTDVADHVNNSVYWELLEEELLGPAGLGAVLNADLNGSAPSDGLMQGSHVNGDRPYDGWPFTIDAEIEFRDGAQPGTARYLVDGQLRSIFDPDDSLLATIAIHRAVRPERQLRQEATA